MEMNFREFVKKDKPMEQKPTTAELRKMSDNAIRNARRITPKNPPKTKPVSESADIMTESQNMISVLQEKVEQVFYRFGMVGLEHLDECMINTIQDLMEGRTTNTNQPTATRRVTPKKPKVVKQPAQQKVTSTDDILAVAAAGLQSMGPMEGRYVAGALASQQTQPQQTYVPPAAPRIRKVESVTMAAADTQPVPEGDMMPLSEEDQALMAQNITIKKTNNFSMDDLAALGAALKG